MIREITFEELEDLLPLASDFHGRMGQGVFSAPSFLTRWNTLMRYGVGRILVRFSLNKPVEAIGYLTGPNINTGETTAHALFWMFSGDGGLASGHLYRAFIERCRELGARRATFQVPTTSPRREKFESFLQGVGFEHTETLHTIDLWQQKQLQ